MRERDSKAKPEARADKDRAMCGQDVLVTIAKTPEPIVSWP